MTLAGAAGILVWYVWGAQGALCRVCNSRQNAPNDLLFPHCFMFDPQVSQQPNVYSRIGSLQMCEVCVRLCAVWGLFVGRHGDDNIMGPPHACMGRRVVL